jgi:hypothetical protein
MPPFYIFESMYTCLSKKTSPHFISRFSPIIIVGAFFFLLVNFQSLIKIAYNLLCKNHNNFYLS